MLDRRIARRTDSLAAKARREFWERKQSESENTAQMEKARDSALVADWTARFHAARNTSCEGQKNFRGIGQVD